MNKASEKFDFKHSTNVKFLTRMKGHPVNNCIFFLYVRTVAVMIRLGLYKNLAMRQHTVKNFDCEV